jgi:GNAT superfamily N-acetyltransferase
VPDSPLHIRRATAADADTVAELAAALAQSFPFSRAAFDQSYPAVLAAADACLLLATNGRQPATDGAPPATGGGPPATGGGQPATDGGEDPVGYLLGFRHPAFFANAPVAWVEEILVRPEYRGHGAGRALMSAFEQHAADQGCALVALATRRAAAFYRALGYQESASYFRKVLGGSAG